MAPHLSWSSSHFKPLPNVSSVLALPIRKYSIASAWISSSREIYFPVNVQISEKCVFWKVTFNTPSRAHNPRQHKISKMLSESHYLMILHWVSKIGDMQRGCTETAALVLDQKTFSFSRKSILKFTEKKLFCQSCVCKWVGPRFEAGFCRLYWVSCGLW